MPPPEAMTKEAFFRKSSFQLANIRLFFDVLSILSIKIWIQPIFLDNFIYF